nr:alpha/beta hydrolase [Sphingobium amiense]
MVDLLDRAPVAIVGHSLGGSITLRYAGLFPDRVRRVVAIEGLGMSPASMREKTAKPATERWLEWIAERRAKAGRVLRRYPTIEAAVGRMQQRNEHLSLEQALHLTSHGVNRNEDGSYSWKFDPSLSVIPPQEQIDDRLPEFWSRVSCPTLLCLGNDSWASNPAKDGRMAHFQDARLVEFADAGHWLHHDQFDRFIATLGDFLRGEPGDGRAIAGL